MQLRTSSCAQGSTGTPEGEQEETAMKRHGKADGLLLISVFLVLFYCFSYFISALVVIIVRRGEYSSMIFLHFLKTQELGLKSAS